MRLPDEMLNAVCFLCTGEAGQLQSFKYGGTAFFVSIPSERYPNQFQHIYLVTAKHNIERASNTGQTLHVRLNTKTGGAGFVPVTYEWFYSDNEAEDVAVLPWSPPMDGDQPADVDFKCFPAHQMAGNRVIEDVGIGIGEEIAIIGLFSQRHGATKNYPIVRSGIISAMPGEPFQDDSGAYYHAYLAEIRSIGGLSGSPVIVTIDPMRPGALGARKAPPVLHSVFYLLGLIRSHWDLKRKHVSLDFGDDELQQVNMGIAQVTPIHDLMRIILREDLKKLRREVEDQELKRRAAAS